jgi:hypothetical protein
MKNLLMLTLATIVMTLSIATGAVATEQSTPLPANGVSSITQSGDTWTINLASADASEVKYIKPGNTVLCSEHDGKPKNGNALCDKTSYTVTSNADCVMFQVDWTDNKYNSSDPVKCREKTTPTPEPTPTPTTPVVTPPVDDFPDKEVQACWKVDDWKNGDDDWPQTRVNCPIPDKSTVCSDERYQFDKYWIRDKADQDKFDGLKTLENSGLDASLEPHDYYVKTVKGDDDKCKPVTPEPTKPVPAVPTPTVNTPVVPPATPTPTPEKPVKDKPKGKIGTPESKTVEHKPVTTEEVKSVLPNTGGPSLWIPIVSVLVLVSGSVIAYKAYKRK